MFLGRAVEAEELYLRLAAAKVDDKLGADVMKADFASMRRHDLNHALMDEIEALLGARKVYR
jgi:hypothetical protein